DLLTPTGRRSFTVRGLLETHGIARAFGGNLVVMDLPAAQMAFLRPGLITRLDVVVQRSAALHEVALAVAGVLPTGWLVEAPAQRKADLHRVMASLPVMLDALSAIALAAAFLIIFNRLTTVFETRAWQLGVLRAVGVRSGAIWRELLKESLLLGLVGTALGIPGGIAVGRLLLPIVATTAALNFKLVAAATNLSLHLRSFLAAAALGPAVAGLAAALPAWRIARVPPVETIRGHGMERTAGSRGGWAVRAVVAAALAGTLAAQSALYAPAWGLVATALIAVATALAADPLVQLVFPALVSAVRAVIGPCAWLARGSFAR